MDYFDYRNGELYAEQVPVRSIADRFGTPTYVYSRATIERHWQVFDQAIAAYPHLVCYAVKANSNLAVLRVLARLGSGFDIVSGGELARVLRAGGRADRIVFSGVGKHADEIRTALKTGIYCFNVESEPELKRIMWIAQEMGVRAPVALRVNPDVDAKTHPYISTGLKENKFGIEIDVAERLYREAAVSPHLDILGVDCHIGSQLTDTKPFADAVSRVLASVDRLAAAGIQLRHLNIGGGLGIRYRDEQPPSPGEYARTIGEVVGSRKVKLIIEPGRAIVGNAGILLTRVEYIKRAAEKHFAIVDAAMNDLVRPALYGSWQEIIPVHRGNGASQRYDVVGPVCETGDFLGKERDLAITEGDLLAVRSAGAYGFVMSSNYNTRPRAAEVMVDDDRMHLVRARETVDDLLRPEIIPDGFQ